MRDCNLFNAKLFQATILTLITLSVTACGAPPKRADYTGPDQVTELSDDFLLGKWQARVLNPVAGEGDHTAIYEYTNDGQWTGIIDTASSGDVQVGVFEANGTWSIEGQYVMATVGDIRETSGNPLAGLMLGAMRSGLQKQVGKANPHEVTSDRIIWVQEGTGQAMQMDRVTN